MKLTTIERKRYRVRNKLRTSSNNKRYRLCVSRTTRNISAQIIDDINEIKAENITENSSSSDNSSSSNKTTASTNERDDIIIDLEASSIIGRFDPFNFLIDLSEFIATIKQSPKSAVFARSSI